MEAPFRTFLTSMALVVPIGLCSENPNETNVVGWGERQFIGRPVVKIRAMEDNAIAIQDDGTVSAWGASNNSQTAVPDRVQAIDAVTNTDCSLIVRTDSTLLGIQCGTIPTNLGKIRKVALARGSFLALRSDSSLVTWGTSKFAIPSNATKVTDIASGSNSFVALRSDSTVVAWASPTTSPSFVPSDLRSVVAIASSGAGPGLALLANGKVRSWGGYFVPDTLRPARAIACNSWNGASVDSSGRVQVWRVNYGTPLPPPVGLDSVVSLAAGTFFFVALRSNGSLVAWGSERYGTTSPPSGLGIATSLAFADRRLAVLRRDSTVALSGFDIGSDFRKPPPDARFVQVAVAGNAVLGLRADSTVVSWGNDTTLERIPDSLMKVQFVGGGGYTFFAQTLDGTLHSWGTDSALLVSPRLPGRIRKLRANSSHAVALLEDGSVYSWGDNTYGRASMPGSLGRAIDITASFKFSAAINEAGTLVMWGNSPIGADLSSTGSIRSLASGVESIVAEKVQGGYGAWGSFYVASAWTPRDLPRLRNLLGDYLSFAGILDTAVSVTVRPGDRTLPSTDRTGTWATEIRNLRGELVHSGPLPWVRGRCIGAGIHVPVGTYLAKATGAPEVLAHRLVVAGPR